MNTSLSLQKISYEALLSALPVEVVEKLSETALEKRKRDISIVLTAPDTKPFRFYRFENITKTELPQMMKKFPNEDLIETFDLSLFELLIEKRHKELEGNEMFKDVLSKLTKTEGYVYFDERCNIPSELITELYANILSYKELIEDINNVFDEYFVVCFEDDDIDKEFVDRMLSM